METKKYLKWKKELGLFLYAMDTFVDISVNMMNELNQQKKQDREVTKLHVHSILMVILKNCNYH
jgi:hypothetical protein